jgi:hypothetical protein
MKVLLIVPAWRKLKDENQNHFPAAKPGYRGGADPAGN